MPALADQPSSAQEFAALDPELLVQRLAGPPEEAAQWILASAKLGVPEAQALFGQILLDGRGVEKDAAQARNWFQQAAHSGHVMGMNMLGRCHELGWGGAVDLLSAAYWYQQAAERGLDWGLYNYANLLSHDDSVLSDRARALELYRKAAAMGHAKSINLVGRFYEEGWVVETNFDTAFDYYRQSAIAGDFRGQYNYGRFLADRGCMDEAVLWTRKTFETATPGFIKKMRHALIDSPHAQFREIAQMALQHNSVS
jgi:TPR repeat protein